MVPENKILKPWFFKFYKILFHILKNSYKKQQVQEGYHEQKISVEKT